jgi:hypothetical protein
MSVSQLTCKSRFAARRVVLGDKVVEAVSVSASSLLIPSADATNQMLYNSNIINNITWSNTYALHWLARNLEKGIFVGEDRSLLPSNDVEQRSPKCALLESGLGA